MFKLIWSNKDPASDRTPAADPAPGAEQLRMLIEHFPIGRKIAIFPSSSATSSSRPSSSPTA